MSLLYKDVQLEIAKFIVPKQYKLCDWIDIDKINWRGLSGNPNDGALDLLEQNLDKIVWDGLSGNPNERALDLLEQNPNKIRWRVLSRNPNDRALDLLEQNPNKIYGYCLESNPNKRALDLLEKNPDKIDRYRIPYTHHTLELLLNISNYTLDIFNNIDWFFLSRNSNDHALDLLEQNPDKIDWYGLCGNRNVRALNLLEQNQDKIQWYELSANPSIFIEDNDSYKQKLYEFIKTHFI